MRLGNRMSDANWPTLSGYTLKTILGKGGFSTVYLAQQTTLQRNVALKVMNPLMAADEDFCARFLREARDTALVSEHPNIVTIFDVGQEGSLYYIAMQYLPGGTLRQRLDSSRPEPQPARLIHQLAQALAHVHQCGFVHRDIKPANVLFNEHDEAVLSDFGFAHMSGRSTQMTQQGAIIGTARYMSPEQCRGQSTLDARSDLYSLGVVAYEIIMQHAPFDHMDMLAIMYSHLNDPVPPLRAEHARYQPMIHKLMAKKPQKRYASAGDVLVDLRKLAPEHLASKAATSTPQTSAASKPTTTRETRRETPAAAVLGVAFAILATLTGALLFLRAQTEPEQHIDPSHCPPITSDRLRERDALLEIAAIHEQTGRLTHPPGANALEAYTLAIETDPCNPQIIEALTRLRGTP